jgi:hypothetical protein
MGGRARLAQVKTLRADVIKHTLLMEQSYRQAPFITSYERDRVTLDLAGKRFRSDAHGVWPESDPGTAESDATLVGSTVGAVYRGDKEDSPASLGDLEKIRRELELGPLSLLLTAAAAPDLHLEPPETIRAAVDDVVGFTWRGVATRIAIHPVTHLPDALETTQQLDDFWFYWGDVRRRIYFDNWHVLHGLHYPTNEVEERNGTVWESRQALSVDLDPDLPDVSWKMDPAAAAKTAESKGWNRPPSPKPPVELAPGIELSAGSWNVTTIVQPDGLVLLEAPISGPYVDGVLAAAQQRHPGLPIKAVLTTSDSWPHVGGVRACVAKGLPLYVLDLNRPLLERFVAAPHTLLPDDLASAPGRKPDFRVVSEGQAIGDGDNRMVVYPLRGAATERQYMVYFPQRRLLYASDTLVLNDDGSLYDPELTDEVAQAVAREKLDVERVYAMHQPPIPWTQAAALVEAARSAAEPPRAPAATPGPMSPLAPFAGTFSCAGKFSNGESITSKVRIELDLGGAAMIKHHDDTSPPALYHAVEVWTYQPKERRFLASITDNFGGVRQFSAPGVEGATVSWTSGPGVTPKQQFVYTKVDDETIQLDWRTAGARGGWVLGDRLTCKKAR